MYLIVATMSSTVERRLRQLALEAELLVDLVAADLGQVVALGVEVEVVEQGLRGLLGRRLARAQLAVDVEQRVVLAGGVVLLQGQAHRLVVAELLEDAVVGPAERLEEHGDRLLALAVDAHADHVALVDLELEPGTAARDDLGGVDVLVGRLVGRALEVDARAADELRDDDALGAVDDEGAALGHQREVAHEHRLALDLAGGVVHELRGDEQRGGVGEVPLLALLDGVLGLLEAVVAEAQRHRAAEVLDRGDLLEDLLEPGAVGDVVPALRLRRGDPGLPALVPEEPVEALGLEGQEVGDLQGLADLGERQSTSDASLRCSCAWRCARQPRRVPSTGLFRLLGWPHPTGQDHRDHRSHFHPGEPGAWRHGGSSTSKGR